MWGGGSSGAGGTWCAGVVQQEATYEGGEPAFPAFRPDSRVVTFSQNQVIMKSYDGVVVKCAGLRMVIVAIYAGRARSWC